MRDVKFRAWHKLNKELVYFDNDKLVNDQYQMQHLACLMRGDYGDVLMQYTGIKDKNGAEIYEGDFVPFDGENLKCIIETDGVWFENDNLTMRHDDFKKYGEPLTVIGNIHQNPELLP